MGLVTLKTLMRPKRCVKIRNATRTAKQEPGSGYCRNILAPGPIGSSSTTQTMSRIVQPIRNTME
jgi:hypothetical protein